MGLGDLAVNKKNSGLLGADNLKRAGQKTKKPIAVRRLRKKESRVKADGGLRCVFFGTMVRWSGWVRSCERGDI